MAAFAAGGRGKDSQPSTSSTTTTTTYHHHPRWNVRAFAQRGRTMVTRETEKMREKIREHNNNNKKNRTAAAVDDDDGVVVPRTRRKEDYYSVMTVLVIRLAKLVDTNEKCFENIIHLSYLIP